MRGARGNADLARPSTCRVVTANDAGVAAAAAFATTAAAGAGAGAAAVARAFALPLAPLRSLLPPSLPLPPLLLHSPLWLSLATLAVAAAAFPPQPRIEFERISNSSSFHSQPASR